MQPQELSEVMKKTLEGGNVSRILSIKVIKNGFSKAKKLRGSGRQPFSDDLEELVYQWILSKPLQEQRSTKLIVSVCEIFYAHFKNLVLLFLSCFFVSLFRKHLENKPIQK